jgi:prefoldin subunit 5
LSQLASTIKIKKVQKVVKKLSKSCQTVVKKLSKSCQKAVKKLSIFFQKVVKKLSKNCQKMSKSCQSFQKNVQKLSNFSVHLVKTKKGDGAIVEKVRWCKSKKKVNSPMVQS